MFDVFIFDLDGTLTDSKDGIINCVKYALEFYGIEEHDEEVLLRFIGPPLYDSFTGVYGFSHERALEAVNKYRERFSTVGLFENALISGAEEVLSYLKKSGKTVVLATSKPIVYAKRIIEEFGISEFFDFALGAELNGDMSRKEDLIGEALKRAEVGDLSKAVMIGDRSYDIAGAKKCKIASVGLRSGYAESGELEKAGADFIFENLHEMRKFFENNA